MPGGDGTYKSVFCYSFLTDYGSLTLFIGMMGSAGVSTQIEFYNEDTRSQKPSESEVVIDFIFDKNSRGKEFKKVDSMAYTINPSKPGTAPAGSRFKRKNL